MDYFWDKLTLHFPWQAYLIGLQQATAFKTACFGIKNNDSMSNKRPSVCAETNRQRLHFNTKSVLFTTDQLGLQGKLKACTPSSLHMGSQERRGSTRTGRWTVWMDKRWNQQISCRPTYYCPRYTINLAPDAILQLIRCGCESDTPCRSSRYDCWSANLSRTMSYVCHNSIFCNTDALWLVIVTRPIIRTNHM